MQTIRKILKALLFISVIFTLYFGYLAWALGNNVESQTPPPSTQPKTPTAIVY